MISAMHSGAGKTVMSCALLAALKKRGITLSAFKCGPDYIDPMFHSSVLGIPCRNLDLFLQGAAGVKKTLGCGTGELALLEGAMGYYDGENGTEKYSAYEIARLCNTPAVLVLRPKGNSISLAAQVKGMMEFRPGNAISALLLADCTERLNATLRPVLERETGLPVLGYLPPMPEARFESRHLGLMTADEITDLQERLDSLACQSEQSIDLDSLLRISREINMTHIPEENRAPRCCIAVARDQAFCFLYQDNLDALREAGAVLQFFSPLKDKALPEGAAGLYLPGGYPELFTQALSENASMRECIAGSVSCGMPTVAECGGFLYLQQSMEDERGKSFPMCGFLPGHGYRTDRLRRFGYQKLFSTENSLLFRAGEEIPAHEFHYWDSTDPGDGLISKKADGRTWACGFTGKNLYAAFPHLHFGGMTPFAERFVKACEEYGKNL